MEAPLRLICWGGIVRGDSNDCTYQVLHKWVKDRSGCTRYDTDKALNGITVSHLCKLIGSLQVVGVCGENSGWMYESEFWTDDGLNAAN